MYNVSETEDENFEVISEFCTYEYLGIFDRLHWQRPDLPRYCRLVCGLSMYFLPFSRYLCSASPSAEALLRG